MEKHPKGMPWPDAKPLLLQTLQAFEYANSGAKRVVHRDLKLSNIFVTTKVTAETQAPLVKLIDFGIARHEDSGVTRTSSTADMRGSFDYMAPDFISED